MPALVALLVGAILLNLPGFARCQTVPQAVLDLQACEKEYQADVREQQDRLAGFNECSRRAVDKTTRPPLTEEEMKAMRQKQEDAQRFEQTVRGRLAALRDADVTLEFSSCCAGFNYIFHGCVIGKGGSVYLYDEKFNFSNSGQLTAEEYNKASELATKLTNKVLAARRIGFDAAKAQWSVHR